MLEVFQLSNFKLTRYIYRHDKNLAFFGRRCHRCTCYCLLLWPCIGRLGTSISESSVGRGSTQRFDYRRELNGVEQPCCYEHWGCLGTCFAYVPHGLMSACNSWDREACNLVVRLMGKGSKDMAPCSLLVHCWVQPIVCWSSNSDVMAYQTAAPPSLHW